jgi:putative oxidoreductase
MSEQVLTSQSEPSSNRLVLALIETRTDYSALILRLGLGLVIFPHGAQKLFSWFGGYGFSGTMNFFTETMGIPYLFALLVILVESLGAVALIAGLVTRVSALAIGVTIGVAAVMAHLQNGFFMNWSGTQAGEGFEYHILVVVMSLALVVKGGGLWSVDSLLTQKIRKNNSF